MKNTPPNRAIAAHLEQIADLLETQQANPFRVRAYRNGAGRVRGLDRSVAEMIRGGDGQALQDLPDIGSGLAQVITQFVHSGHSAVLDRLQGEVSPDMVFTQVPGIGEELAGRIAERLDIDTLEELEQAAHDGRLESVPGFGPRRIKNVRTSLAGMLSQAARRRSWQRTQDESSPSNHPQVATLLEVDREYRRKAAAGELHRIAPRRFNPDNKAWLPILHTKRADWEFTVLFSNTARAHKLEKTGDWVVIYYERGDREDQATVVTATQGALENRRVVRGREYECERYYNEKE